MTIYGVAVVTVRITAPRAPAAVRGPAPATESGRLLVGARGSLAYGACNRAAVLRAQQHSSSAR